MNMIDLSKVTDAKLVLEIYSRIKGESEMQQHLNYLYRAAFRPIYTFFDKQNIDEANIRMYKQADWEALEAERDEVSIRVVGQRFHRCPTIIPKCRAQIDAAYLQD
jgi:hypothetical protein